MEDVFEMAASEVNFLVLLLWVAMAALLIVLIAMGVKNRRRRRLCDPRKDHYRKYPFYYIFFRGIRKYMG